MWSIDPFHERCVKTPDFRTKLTATEDMHLFVTSVLAQEPWKYDPKVIPMPWRQSEADGIERKMASGGLTLGFYNCDGNVSSSIKP